MQKIINGEQPFQVLNSSFTIGPSESGYDLYFSADGREYSKLFTVAANTNRQVTQVAAGSYYYLEGNTDTAVTVNWIANCYNGGGGGGGSYTLPTATANRLGGVKVGSGLTVENDGTLNVSGGTGESNYVIVSDLEDIQDPYEGLIAYVEAHEVEEVYTGLTLTTTETENYVGFLYDGNGEQKAQVYISGDQFHWDWENDGEIHSRGDYFYQTDTGNSTFIFYVPESDWYVEAHTENTETGTTDNYTYTRHIEGIEYRYNGEDWERMNNIRVLYLDEMTRTELEDLYSEIFRYTEDTFPAGRYHFYAFNGNNDEYRGWFEVYVARFYSGQPVSFSGHMQSRNSKQIFMRGYELDSDGNFYLTFEGNANVPSIVYASFGNDDRGGLTYDADNDCFLYSSGTVATGDTSNYAEDLIDWNYLGNGLFSRTGRFEDAYVFNSHVLNVQSNNETLEYAQPAISKKPITNYTIGEKTFKYEITFKFSDYVLKMDVPEENAAANLRITQA